MRCPRCGSKGEKMGKLGSMTWWKCRGCGSQYGQKGQ